MDLRQMEYFRIAAEYENVTLAAQVLHISQPSLSVSIAKLEKELGTPLFDRVGGHICLNNSGRIFLRHVEKILLGVKEAAIEVSDQATEGSKEITIAVNPMGISTQLVTNYVKQHPYARLKHFAYSSEHIIPSLERLELDFAITNEYVETYGVEWIPLMTEPVMVLVSRDNELASRKYVELDDLREQKFVIQRSAWRPKGEYSEIITNAKWEPRVVFETNELDVAYTMTEQGGGIMMVSYFAAERLSSVGARKLCGVPLLTNKPPRTIGIARVSGHYLTKAVRDFYDYAISYYTEVGKRLQREMPWLLR